MACVEPPVASRCWSDLLPASRCPRRAAMAAIAVPLIVAAVAAGAFPDEQAEGRELRGKLEDGTDYMICVPAHWYGVVFNDLDMIWWEKRPIFQHLLREGYAISGTRRRTGPRQTGHWCEFANMRRVQETLAIFRAKIGEPKRVIAIGCSAGGAVAIATAEIPYDRIDAAIAICATTGALTVNQAFDLFSTTKPSAGNYVYQNLINYNDGNVIPGNAF